MNLRNTYIGIAIAAAVLIAYFFVRFPWNPDENQLKLGYDAGSINHAPIIIAIEHNLFEKHGIAIEPISITSGSTLKHSLATGIIDVGISNIGSLLSPIAKGAPVKIIAPLTLSGAQLYVRPDGSIRSIKDLAGKSIASRITSTANISFLIALEEEGISKENINFMDIESEFRALALTKQKIVDAAVISNHESKLFDELGAIVLPEWKEKGYAAIQNPQTTIGINTNFLENHEEIADRFINAVIEAQEIIKEDPQSAAAILANHYSKNAGIKEYTADYILNVWEKIQYKAWIDPSIIITASHLSVDEDGKPYSLTEEQIFDLSFKEKLQEAEEDIYGTKN